MAAVAADMEATEPCRINTVRAEPEVGRRISVTMGSVTTVPVPGRDTISLPCDVARKRPSISSITSIGSATRDRTKSEESVASGDAAAFVPVPPSLERRLSTGSIASTPAARRPSWLQAPTPDSHWFQTPVSGLSFGIPDEVYSMQHTVSEACPTDLSTLPPVTAELATLNESEDFSEEYKPPPPLDGETLESLVAAMSVGAGEKAVLDASVAYQVPYFGAYWPLAPEADYTMPGMQMSGAQLLFPYMNQVGLHMGAQHFPPAHASVMPEAVTTIMLRNIPQRYNREMLLEDIDARGFCGAYDFFYLPIDFSTTHSVGYAFINFVNDAEPLRFKGVYDGLKLSEDSPKVCEVCDAKVQGRVRNVEFYRNSTVMGMDEQYHPVLLDGGVRFPFPQPTRALWPTPPPRLPRPTVWPVERRPPRAGGQFKQQH